MFSQRKSTRKPPQKISNPAEQNTLIQLIRQTFTPGAPIDDPAMFAARRDEVMRLHNFVQTPGEVAFIFGERGVGKTSLAKHTAAKFSKEFNWKDPLFKSCDPDDEFATLLAQPLREVGVDILVDVECTEEHDQRYLNVKLRPLGGKLGGNRKDMEIRRGNSSQASQPSWAAEKLAGLRRIFVIDELDILDLPETKRKLATFIKHLSDRRSQFKIVITGIAESMEELLAGHASNLRCLKEVRLRRMTEDDVAAVRSGSTISDSTMSGISA
jgi:Cdc6-like AAA superfamily ATPase